MLILKFAFRLDIILSGENYLYNCFIMQIISEPHLAVMLWCNILHKHGHSPIGVQFYDLYNYIYTLIRFVQCR